MLAQLPWDMEIGCCDNLLGMHKDVVAKHGLAGLEGAVVSEQNLHAGHKKAWIVQQYGRLWKQILENRLQKIKNSNYTQTK